MKSIKGALLAAGAVVAAVLVPLYGDPRRAPVTHAEWARMLLRAMDMESALAPGTTASFAFDSLSWRTSLTLAPDKPFRSTGVEFVPGPPRLARADGTLAGELGYRLAIGRPGDYQIRLKLGGEPRQDAAAALGLELTPEGESTPVKSLSLAASAAASSGPVYLAQRAHTLSVALPPGASLESIEVVPPCVDSIEPKGGWHAAAIAQTGDVAVTALKALDLQAELPPAASPIELPVLGFLTTGPETPKANLKRGNLEGFWLEANGTSFQAVAQFEVPEPGLYTLYGFGLAGGGQSWVADSCRKAVVCPTREKPETPQWRPILTDEFSAGRHSLALTLVNGAALQRVRLERKKDGIADYLGTLARLGLDLGEQRPIPRPLAVEAMKFIELKGRALLDKCGDVFAEPGTLVAGLAMPPGSTLEPGSNPQPAPGEPGPVVPLPGPSSPPSPPNPSPGPSSSPTPGPVVSPSPSPRPSPSPSVGPPPTTVPQQPASPVKE